jgi:acyl-CoA synthetase (AMP-forming)/AMP-acid ligase II
MNPADPAPLIHQASMVTVGDLLRHRARVDPDRIAIEQGDRRWRYAAFDARVDRLAAVLGAEGVGRGDRVAILSENRLEYLELIFAAARIGAIVAALNWRLVGRELEHCVRLVSPRLAMVSPRYEDGWARLDAGVSSAIVLGADYEARLAAAVPREATQTVEPEDGLLILYTSGTTGLPKGALISHRAQIARLQVALMDWNLERDDAFVAWPPMFHMASADQCIATLAVGGKVVVVDGFDVERILDAVERDDQWWLVLMPGMIEPVIREARRRSVRPKRLKRIGAMADLVPLAQIAEVTGLLRAPYANTFGSTETGLPPLSLGVVAPGATPGGLSKTPDALCRVELVDADDRPVPDGAPGELAFSGPTLFSGYWNAPETNARDFRGGRFHMGDMFRRLPDGTYAFVDRVKYLIKSGGENIYPAEVERVLLAEPRVLDAIVVRRADAQWGEVPVAVVVRKDEGLGADELTALCRRELAGYKRPKEIRFVRSEELPRSATGKIQRHEVEALLERWDRRDRSDADRS